VNLSSRILDLPSFLYRVDRLYRLSSDIFGELGILSLWFIDDNSQKLVIESQMS
jgi:hypothetical protein